MNAQPGRCVSKLETPALLVDLNLLERNLAEMMSRCVRAGKQLRVHFKSLKCGGLAQFLANRGVHQFLCAKLNEVEILVEAGQKNVLLANQVVDPEKVRRLAKLARLAKIGVCVDDIEQVRLLGEMARSEQVNLEIYIEVDIGMDRCGVSPGEETLQLAKQVSAEPHLILAGLQGYDGHLQLITDRIKKAKLVAAGLDQLNKTRELLEAEGFSRLVVTGSGTGTCELAADHPALTEWQPGSFLFMDAVYHKVCPQYHRSLSVLTSVISRRAGKFVLDAGSKAISQDFGKPEIKNHPGERVEYLAEEHTRVTTDGSPPALGELREVFPSHCCATVNLHRRLIAVRDGVVKAVWSIECSGRYD